MAGVEDGLERKRLDRSLRGGWGGPVGDAESRARVGPGDGAEGLGQSLYRREKVDVCQRVRVRGHPSLPAGSLGFTPLHSSQGLIQPDQMPG